MENSFIIGLFSALLFGVLSVGLWGLLNALYRMHWAGDNQEKVDAAIELFEGDRDAARTWLSTPIKSLGVITPLEAKKDEVKTLIGRLEHGVRT